MSKTRDTGFLGNVVKVDSTGNVSFVSGSTTLMSISSSGAVTTTGVISGSNALSSSYALNADQVDGLNSTSFVFTSSYNTDSSSVSTRVTRIEGNYATTGSNVFLGAQTVCANITSTGTIIAQTLNVQQVTSSIVYSSGSNVFGCSLSNTQQFTGSVTMTGSLTVTTTGTSPEFQVAVGGTTIGNALTDVHQVTGSLRMTGSNALFSVGCLGIGTTSPVTKLDVIGNARLFPASGDVNLSLRGFASQYINFTEASVADRGVIGFAIGSGDLVYRSGGYDMSTGTERIRITSGGNVGIGGTPSRRLDVYVCDSATYATTCAGNVLGIINTYPANNTFAGITFATEPTAGNAGLAAINSTVTSAGNADLMFSTRASSVLGERMRITSGGNVGIGTCSPSNTALHIVADWVSGNSTVKVQPSTGTTSGYGVYDNTGARKGIFYREAGYVAIETNSEPLLLNTNGIERMRITSTGIACFACTVCAPTFVGSLSGNASTATNASTSTRPAATATRSGNFSSGTVNGTENVDISSYYLPYFGPVWFYFNASYNGNGAIQANWLGLADAHYFNNGTANIIWTDDGATGAASMPSISVSVQGSTYNTRYLRVAFTATGGYAPNNWNWTFGAWNAFP